MHACALKRSKHYSMQKLIISHCFIRLYQLLMEHQVTRAFTACMRHLSGPFKSSDKKLTVIREVWMLALQNYWWENTLPYNNFEGTERRKIKFVGINVRGIHAWCAWENDGMHNNTEQTPLIHVKCTIKNCDAFSLSKQSGICSVWDAPLIVSKQ